MPPKTHEEMSIILLISTFHSFLLPSSFSWLYYIFLVILFPFIFLLHLNFPFLYQIWILCFYPGNKRWVNQCIPRFSASLSARPEFCGLPHFYTIFVLFYSHSSHGGFNPHSFIKCSQCSVLGILLKVFFFVFSSSLGLPCLRTCCLRSSTMS